MTRDFQASFALPAGATEVILARHGSSADHESHGPFELVGGQSDPPLAPTGHDQALTLVDRLRHEPIAAIFVSPLQRAVQTAAPLAEVLGIRPLVLAGLREVHLGSWEADGVIYRVGVEPNPTWRRVLEEESWSLIDGAERMSDFGARVHAGLEEVARGTGPDRAAVAVTHGGVIAQACAGVTGSRPFAFFATENCSITRLVRTADARWSLQSFNETPPRAQTATGA
jgi:probable phosphoglycerate mutase